MKLTRMPDGTELDLEPLLGEKRAPNTATHNQSVLKAVALIGCFVDSAQGRTLTELAKRTDLNVSTAYRMLQTLTYSGVLRRNEGEERYFAGPMLLALAGSTFSNTGMDVVSGVLNGLANELGESVSLGIRDANCVAVLLSASSPQQFRFDHRPGSRVLLHCSAMGKAMLAFDAVPFATSVAELGRLQPLTPKSITNAAQLVAELEQVRQRGYAESDEEHHIGVRSLAVVARRDNETPRLALGVQAPRGRMSEERIADILPTLKAAADLIAKLPIVDRLPAA